MKKFFSTRYSDSSFNLSMFVIRLGVGIILFLNHGWMKIEGFSAMKDRFSDPIHIGPTATLVVAIFAEVVCALFLVLGLMTRFISFILVLHFLTIIFLVHHAESLKSVEMAIFYLILSLTLMLCGPGKWSIDRLIGK